MFDEFGVLLSDIKEVLGIKEKGCVIVDLI